MMSEETPESAEPMRPEGETEISAGTGRGASNGALSRRRALAIGAVTASMVVTVRPAFAQTAVSVLNCQIPVPDLANSTQYIDPYGALVPSGTQGAFPGAPRPFTGEEVKGAFAGRTLPGTSYDQTQAYLQYIRRLRAGQSGFTCYASIQMPR